MRLLFLALFLCIGFALPAQAAEAIKTGIGVEVHATGIKILGNKAVFGDDNPRRIQIADLPKRKDFQKLLQHILDNQNTEIITFLVEANGADTYEAAAKVVREFEGKHKKELLVNMLPDGTRFLASLSGKSPMTQNTNVQQVLKKPPNPKDEPRDKEGKPLLEKLRVYVQNGKVFLLDDKQVATALKAAKQQLENILDEMHIPFDEGNVIRGGDEAEELVKKFNEKPIVGDNCKIRLSYFGHGIDFEISQQVRLVDQTLNRDPAGRLFKAIAGRSNVLLLQYVVEATDDSFETYEKVRATTDEQGFLAGWRIASTPYERNSYREPTGYSVDTPRNVLD